MKKEQHQISDHLTLEVVQEIWPVLWISRKGGERVHVELSEVEHLARILTGLATDLAGYQVGECVPVTSKEGADEWRRLVGQIVRVPDGNYGTVMGPVGDWSKAHENGSMVVCFPNRAPGIFHLSDIKPITEKLNPDARFDSRMH